MPNITRNNHYAPEAILKRCPPTASEFALTGFLFRIRGSAIGGANSSGLTRQTDFYTEHRSGHDVDAFETFITRGFEAPGQRAIEKLLARGRMTATDWHSIARFVVTQDMRTPQDFIE